MKKIVLTQGKVALVDDQDFDWLSQWKWCAIKDHNTFYACRGIWDGKRVHRIFMHRLILNPPNGFISDHRDSNGLNNQRQNLRIATAAQNRANGCLNKDNHSGYRGVCRENKSIKWKAQIKFRGRMYHLGDFETPEEAGKIYDQKAIELFGEFARPNFSK